MSQCINFEIETVSGEDCKIELNFQTSTKVNYCYKNSDEPATLNNSMNMVAAQLIKCPYKLDIHPIIVAKFRIDIYGKSDFDRFFHEINSINSRITS